MTTKRCITCFCEKSLDGFYRHPKMADGHLNKCIVCVKAYQSGRQREGKAREYERARALLPHRVEARKEYVKSEAGKQAKLRAQQKSRALHADKAYAREQVAYALRVGRIRRMPCEVCGRETVHAHHDDYSKPLQVRWLCIAHHAEHHRRAALIAHLAGVQKQQEAA